MTREELKKLSDSALEKAGFKRREHSGCYAWNSVYYHAKIKGGEYEISIGRVDEKEIQHLDEVTKVDIADGNMSIIALFNGITLGNFLSSLVTL